MDDRMISELMSNLDNDLILQELDQTMTDIYIDVESIAQKVHWKLQKGKKNMKKQRLKLISIVAAALIVACGGMAAYASEISAFIQSLMNKTGVYGTVVDGQTYYLAKPLDLENGNQLNQAMFNKNELQIQVELVDGKYSDVKICIDGTEMKPNGMEGNNLFFYDVKPTSQFDLILTGKNYPVQLTSSESIVAGSEISEVQAGAISWISMGYKKIDGGIQLLATVDDPSAKIVFYKTPSKDTVKQTSNNQGISNSNREDFLPILGYDQDGNAYEFHADPSDMGHPLTKYTTNAPAGKSLTVKLPSIVVATEKSTNLKVTIPTTNEKINPSQSIDLGLQKMQLESIERTSDTTAKLRFTLNTGDQENVRIWEAYLASPTAVSTESLWENGTCIMDVTFTSDTTELNWLIENPTFIVDGNWTLNVQ